MAQAPTWPECASSSPTPLTSGATNIKQLGLGVTVAILLDATIVRALLVPAFMRTADGASWWAPSWLRKVHQRVGLQDG